MSLANSTNRAVQRARLATAVFAVAWLGGLWLAHNDLATALPLAVFYAALVVNTYASIRCFAALTPADDRRQPAVDGVLAILYLTLAASLGAPLRFTLATAMLFAVATMKYALLLGVVADLELLRRKIAIDVVGAVAALLALAGVAAGVPTLATSLWTGAFLLANVYLLLINPMYPRQRMLTPEQSANRTSPIPASARRVFHGQIFDVYHWPQQLYDGSVATFEMLKRADTVSVLPTTADGRILLARQQQPDRQPYVSFFGGRVEPGEAPLAAAQRELLEESGATSDDWHLWRSERLSGKIDWTVYTYIARNCGQVGPQALDGGERITVKAVTLDELIALRHDPTFDERHFLPDLERAAHDPAAKTALAKVLFGDRSNFPSPPAGEGGPPGTG